MGLVTLGTGLFVCRALFGSDFRRASTVSFVSTPLTFGVVVVLQLCFVFLVVGLAECTDGGMGAEPTAFLSCAECHQGLDIAYVS